ncbi:MAG: hypothetical protein IJS90_00470 [Clostridia bacterium]|nr:hypothetical protein [Clostridia bacterium]
MKDKITNVFFGTVAWAVWATVIIALFVSFYLLFTGMNKAPVFTVNSAQVLKAASSDSALAENGKSGDDWYKLVIGLEVAASNTSPYSYTAESFELTAPDDITTGYDCFTVLSEPVSYSKAVPGVCELTLYINCPEGEQFILSRAQEFGFNLKGLVGKLGLIKKTFKKDPPGFKLSDFPDVFAEPVNAD